TGRASRSGPSSRRRRRRSSSRSRKPSGAAVTARRSSKRCCSASIASVSSSIRANAAPPASWRSTTSSSTEPGARVSRLGKAPSRSSEDQLALPRAFRAGAVLRLEARRGEPGSRCRIRGAGLVRRERASRIDLETLGGRLDRTQAVLGVVGACEVRVALVAVFTIRVVLGTLRERSAARGLALFERLEVVLVALTPAVREREATPRGLAVGEARDRAVARADVDGQRARGARSALSGSARGASGARRGARAAGSWGGARAAGSWVGARTAGSWVGARAAGSGLGARATRSWRGSRPASPRRSTGATASRGAATRGFAVFERLEVVLVTLAPAVRERHALAFAGAEGEARKRRLTRAHDDGQRANGIAAARRARAAVVRATAARRGSSRSGVGAAAAGSRLAGGARAS